MVHMILGWAWNSAIFQFGITGIVLAGAIFVWVQVPIPAVRHLATGTAAVCAVILFLGPHFYLQGANHVKVQWKAAEERARAMGDQARADALADVARGVRDPFDSDDK